MTVAEFAEKIVPQVNVRFILHMATFDPENIGDSSIGEVITDNSGKDITLYDFWIPYKVNPKEDPDGAYNLGVEYVGLHTSPDNYTYVRDINGKALVII